MELKAKCKVKFNVKFNFFSCKSKITLEEIS